MVHELLSVGSENAVTRDLLIAATGLSERALRHLVEKERLSGVPILTDTERGGYYLPSCPAETERFVKSMRRRGIRVLQVARAVEKTMLEDMGQELIEGWSGEEKAVIP